MSFAIVFLLADGQPWWERLFVGLLVIGLGAGLMLGIFERSKQGISSLEHSRCPYCGKLLKVVPLTGGLRRYDVCHHCGRQVGTAAANVPKSDTGAPPEGPSTGVLLAAQNAEKLRRVQEDDWYECAACGWGRYGTSAFKTCPECGAPLAPRLN